MFVVLELEAINKDLRHGCCDSVFVVAAAAPLTRELWAAVEEEYMP